MSILCLNYQGLGDPQAVSNLRGFLQRMSPKLVFLSENNRSKQEMEVVIPQLGDFIGVFVDARGRIGGLALGTSRPCSLSICLL